MDGGLMDDNFFHLTCHVDSVLISKIEKGEFVNLDKLLPKEKRKRSADNRLEWVQSEGGMYLVPVSDRLTKSIISENGNKHLEFMLLFIVGQTRCVPEKSGNMCLLSALLLQVSFGKMCMNTMSLLDT